MNDRRTGTVFEALADPTRRAVLTMVGRQGPVTATELAAQLPVSRQAVAKHLDALQSAGLVDRARQGRDVRYGLKPDGLDGATAWMEHVGASWDRRLAELARRARSRTKGA